MESKAQIRQKYKLLRSQLDNNIVTKLSTTIANQIQSLDIWQKTYYHIFLSIEKFNEVDTSLIINVLKQYNKKIVLSKSNFDTSEMTHFLLTNQTIIQKNRFGIPEPKNATEVPIAKLDVVFVPLLAFDKNGNRIGYGKGFYDKFLLRCNPSTIKIGLSFFDAENEFHDIDPHDIKLDICVTPRQIYYF